MYIEPNNINKRSLLTCWLMTKPHQMRASLIYIYINVRGCAAMLCGPDWGWLSRSYYLEAARPFTQFYLLSSIAAALGLPSPQLGAD